MTEHQFPLRQQFHKLLVEALQPIWEGDLPGKVLVESGNSCHNCRFCFRYIF